MVVVSSVQQYNVTYVLIMDMLLYMFCNNLNLVVGSVNFNAPARRAQGTQAPLLGKS